MEREKFQFVKPGEVRTRFAPSPTGFLHVGSVRTALFNLLFARKYQGLFILRIEDTDQKRSRPEFEKDIIENLKWLGLKWDEGPDYDFVLPDSSQKSRKYIGNYGPYHQVKRKDIYQNYLEKLLKEQKAYYCFCSQEEIEAQKQEQMSRGEPPRYNGKCAKLSAKEIKKNLAEKKKSIIRFKVPSKKIVFEDAVRGKIEFDTGLLGDLAIAKDLKTPLYNFAVVVDDFEMKISHVIRGEDLLPNTPIQIVLQEALGFFQPKYVHLPLIFGPDRTKLSKRHGAVSVQEYARQGYLAETLINFLAFLGWNPGTEREIFSLPSLIKEFSIERIQKGSAVFNIKRLDFLNGFYIRQKSAEKLTELCLPYLIGAGLISPVLKTEQYPPAYGGFNVSHRYKILAKNREVEFDYLKKIISSYQERLKKLSEISELTDFFFKDKLDYSKKLLFWKNMTPKELISNINKLIEILSGVKKWDKNNLEKILMLETAKTGDRGKLLWPLRSALTGKEASTGPFEIAEILGKEETLNRLKEAEEKLKK